MNKQRRKEIEKVADKINNLDCALPRNILEQSIEGFINEIDDLYNEESDYRDNMPENLQESERYYIADEACNNLEFAKNVLEGLEFDELTEDALCEQLLEVIDYLNSAIEN